MRGKRFLSVLLCAVLVLTLLPVTALAAPPATYYPVDVRNGTVSASTVQIYNGVPYVDSGDTVTVTAALPSGPFAGGYDYSDQAFTYWLARGVALADVKSSSAVFTMPGNAVTLGAHFKTAVSAAPAQTTNPFRDLSATMDVFNDRIGVSYTPARNFTVNLIGMHDLSQYEGIGGDGGAASTLKRAIEEYTDAVDVFGDLRNDCGITYLENAFRAKDQYLTMPRTGENVLLCEENWDRIVDEYLADSFRLDGEDIEELKNMQLFELTDRYFYVEWLGKIFGDQSAACRDVDVCKHDLLAYLENLNLALKMGLPEDLLKKVKLERGNSLYYEAYYVDGGNEVVLYRLGYDVSQESLFSKTGSAWLNLCQPTVAYQKDVAEQHGYDSAVALRTIADKVRVRFVTDEVLTNAANDPFVTTYTSVIVPVPSVLSVFGVTPGAIYTSADTADFYTETENLFEGEPGEGDLRLLPCSWNTDDAAPVTFAGAFDGTVDMFALTRGHHRLTVNFVYQAYTGGVWVDRDTVVPYGVSFTVTDTTPPTVSSVTPNGTGVSVSGNIAITFSEAMDAVAGTVSLNGGAALTGGSWSSDSKTYTVPYSALAYATAYTVTVSGFKDTAGNTIAADSTHTFTTGARPSSGGSDVTYYTITATAGAGGGISPSGSASVAYGNDKTYIITAREGYEIADVLVDGASVGAVSTYTFENVKKAHTIAASFKKTETINPFLDIKPGDWFYDNVLFAYENGLMYGTGSGLFDPNGTMTWGMMVTVLYRMSGDTGSYTNPFSDIAPDAYYGNAVAWAYAKGIVSGTGTNSFSPDAAVTREQFAVMLWNYARYRGYDVSIGEDTNILSYNDAFSISDYAYAALQWACRAGVMQGDDLSNLNPQRSATRAEVAAMLQRFMKR